MLHHLIEYKNNLPAEFCREIVSQFEADSRKAPAVFLDGYKPEIKDSTDLMLRPRDPAWKHIIKGLDECLNIAMDDYAEKFGPWNGNKLFHTGHQIQRTDPSQSGYVWHDDFYFNMNTTRPSFRIVTFLWYLTTLDNEGSTEFYDGTHIYPEEGKLILFPATWDYRHKGNPPRTKDKYLCTGWFYINI
ncbi:hypothetical protein [Synechococcus phage S-8S29]|nr:hypothetical protein [Synechococcus phage S-8S29]